MKIRVTSNLDQFNEALRRYYAEFNVIPQVALRKVGLRTAQRLMAFTPPYNRAEGMAATARDIRKAIFPVSDRWAKKHIREERLRKSIQNYISYYNAKALTEIFGRIWPNANIKVTTGFDPAWHEQSRDRRGRVQNRPATQHATLDAEGLRDYVRKKQENVGMAKGGWYAAIEGLGGNSGEWIARHKRAGSFVDRSAEMPTATIEMTNRSPWAMYHDNAQRTLNAALKSVTDELFKELEQMHNNLASRS